MTIRSDYRLLDRDNVIYRNGKVNSSFVLKTQVNGFHLSFFPVNISRYLGDDSY